MTANGKPRKAALICDPDPVMSHILRHLARQAGFAPSAAFEASQALSRARSEKPELILLELTLPPGGMGLLKALKEGPGPLPRILLITQIETPEDHAQALALGAEAVLLKPFSAAELLRRLRQSTPQEARHEPA